MHIVLLITVRTHSPNQDRLFCSCCCRQSHIGSRIKQTAKTSGCQQNYNFATRLFRVCIVRANVSNSVMYPAGAPACPVGGWEVASLRPQLTLPLLYPCTTKHPPSQCPAHSPNPLPSCFIEVFERADSDPRDEGVLKVEPPAARVSRGGGATRLFGLDFREGGGTQWGAALRSSVWLPPGAEVSCRGLRWCPGFMASREEAVSDPRGWWASLSPLDGRRRAPYSQLPRPQAL